MSIIERITQIIDTEHLNQSELCKVLGIKDSTFSTWKTRGTDPPAKYILLICEFLNVSVDYLLGRTDSPSININNKNGVKSINVNGSVGDNSINNNYSELEKHDRELLEEYNKLSFKDKIKVMNLIAELEETE